MIIYVDGLISDRLLKDLGISDSCILHGDFYHLYKENWPKQHNFGTKCFSIIREYLKAMLLSKDRSEWDSAYQYAKLKIKEHPKKLTILKDIYDNPQYYAGYYTRDMIGNLRLNGMVAAEQNHSSITSMLGNCLLYTSPSPRDS